MESKEHYRELRNNPAFIEVMEWLHRYERPHLEAKAPNTLLPNYGEVAAADAAQYRVVRDLRLLLDKRAGNILEREIENE